MQPSLGIGFTAAADGREVKVDADATLLSVTVAASAAGVRAVISRDPKATIANQLTSPSNIADENFIAFGILGTQTILSVPVFANQSLFVSVTAACQVVLNFQLIQL